MGGLGMMGVPGRPGMMRKPENERMRTMGEPGVMGRPRMKGMVGMRVWRIEKI